MGAVGNSAWSLIQQLCEAEMAEQSTWPVDIAPWHPRCEGDADDDGDDDDGSGDDDGKDTRTEAEKAAQAEVDKAYAKLRDAEAERDKYKADLTKVQRTGMGDLERAQQEAEDAKLEAATLKEQLDDIEWRGEVAEVAKAMKFKKPEAARRFVDKSSRTTAEIRKALKDAVSDIPELVGEGTPPPPINDDKKNGGGENGRMNSMIRQAAGRA